MCNAKVIRTDLLLVRELYANEYQWRSLAVGTAFQVLFCFRMKMRGPDMHPIMRGDRDAYPWSFAALAVQSKHDPGQFASLGLLFHIELISHLSSGPAL